MTEDRPAPGATLADFFAFCWRHRRLLVAITGTLTLAALVYVLVVPVQYTARATLLPEDQEDAGLLSGAMSAMAGISLPSFDLSALGGTMPVREAILESERMADLMNAEFGLAARYKADKREEFLREWWERLDVKTNQQGLLTVSLRDRDPELAARMVGWLVEELDRIYLEVRVSSSRRSRIFLDERLTETRARLAVVEDSLADYETTHKALALTPGSQSAMEAGAALLTRRIELQIQAEVLRGQLGPEAPAVRTAELRIEALDRELERLPALNSELARLMRDLEVLQTSYAFLAARLEETRIEEARTASTVDVLDPPVVPEEKSHPRRLLTLLVTLVLSSLLALGTAKVADSVREARHA